MSRVDVQYLIDRCRDRVASPESKLIAWLAEREMERWKSEGDGATAWTDANSPPPIGVPVLVIERWVDSVGPVILTAKWDGEFYKARTPRRAVIATHWMPMPAVPRG